MDAEVARHVRAERVSAALDRRNGGASGGKGGRSPQRHVRAPGAKDVVLQDASANLGVWQTRGYLLL